MENENLIDTMHQVLYQDISIAEVQQLKENEMFTTLFFLEWELPLSIMDIL